MFSLLIAVLCSFPIYPASQPESGFNSKLKLQASGSHKRWAVAFSFSSALILSCSPFPSDLPPVWGFLF